MGQLNPTRKEIIDAQLARQWAEWNKSCEVSSPEIQAAANFILAHTTPPTMADVEWDDEKHYLAEAEHPDQGKVIMLFQTAITENIFIDFHKDGERHLIFSPPEYLTPTGRRYVLQEGE